MATVPPQLDNSEYAVGWIAALPHERAAAESMLDLKRAPPQHKHPNDHNIYTLGPRLYRWSKQQARCGYC